jgi:LuxR family maltose regulon positive regulatory protein
MHLQRGRLSAAAACARRVLDGCRDAGISESHNVTYARLVLTAVCRFRGEFDQARFHLEESITAEALPDSYGWISCGISLALLLRDEGDLAGAAEALEPLLAGRIGTMAPVIEVAVRVLHADLCMLDGRMDKSRALLDEAAGLWPDAAAVGLAVARLNIAEGRPTAAARSAAAVLEAQPHSLVTTVSATVLLAQALRQLGDVAGAAEQVERALRLAAPEGIGGPFLGHGTWIAELLHPQSPLSAGPAHADPPAHLTAGGPVTAMVPDPTAPDAGPALPPAVSAAPVGTIFDRAAETGLMTDPLTERETLVLQYLRSMLSIAEIASVLSVSSNTVKTHVRHVYRKLGVSRRRDAVRRGRELSII